MCGRLGEGNPITIAIPAYVSSPTWGTTFDLIDDDPGEAHRQRRVRAVRLGRQSAQLSAAQTSFSTTATASNSPAAATTLRLSWTEPPGGPGRRLSGEGEMHSSAATRRHRGDATM